MKRTPVLSLATLLVLAVTGWLHSAAAVAKPGVVATVTAVRGRVGVTGTGFQNGAQLRGKEELVILTRLTALELGATVELTCTNGAVQLLSHQFDVRISKQNADVDCAVDVFDGDAFATTNPPAKENGKATANDMVGLSGATATRTQFGISVRRNNPDASSVYVLEGTALVTKSGKQQSVDEGQQYEVKQASLGKVPESRYSTVADNMAKMDFQRAGLVFDEKSLTSLKSAYENSLRAPNDQDARRTLTDRYKSLNIPESQISRYNANKLSLISTVPGTKPPSPPTAVFAGGSGGGAPLAAAQVANNYPNPMVGDFRVAYCLSGKQGCGRAAADTFCKQQGHSRAKSFKEAPLGKGAQAMALGDEKPCRGASCTGFEYIGCE